MRLFIAVLLNEEAKDYLFSAAESLRLQSVSGSFTRRENFHLTLAFLGETERAGDVKQAMNRVKEAPFSITLEGFGHFARRGGDIYWAGIRESGELIHLQEQLSRRLKEAGFSLEDRPFRPHLTLGRQVILKEESFTAQKEESSTAQKEESSTAQGEKYKSEKILENAKEMGGNSADSLKGTADPRAAAARTPAGEALKGPAVPVEGISLMKSERIAGKLVYTPIYERKF